MTAHGWICPTCSTCETFGASRPELQIWYGMYCKFYRSLTQFQDLDTQKRWRHQDLLCRLLDDFLGTFYRVSPASKLLSSSRLVTGSLRKYGVDVGKKKKGAKEDLLGQSQPFLDQFPIQHTTATLKIINEIGKLPNATRKVWNSREIEAFLHSLESRFTLPTIVVVVIYESTSGFLG